MGHRAIGNLHSQSNVTSIVRESGSQRRIIEIPPSSQRSGVMPRNAGTVWVEGSNPVGCSGGTGQVRRVWMAPAGQGGSAATGSRAQVRSCVRPLVRPGWPRALMTFADASARSTWRARWRVDGHGLSPIAALHLAPAGCGRRRSVDAALHQQSPGGACHLVGDRDGLDVKRPAGENAHPPVRRFRAAPCVAEIGYGAEHEECSERGVVRSRYAPQPLLPAARVEPRSKAEPRREVAPGLEPTAVLHQGLPRHAWQQAMHRPQAHTLSHDGYRREISGAHRPCISDRNPRSALRGRMTCPSACFS